jgi:hypothetical protein
LCQIHTIYIVKPVYNEHSMEAENVSLNSFVDSLPFIYRLKLCTLFKKMRLPFMDNDLLYRGAH